MDIQLQPQFESGITRNGDLRYNIQMARDAGGCWHQRHIWLSDGREPRVDPWILSANGRLGPAAHFKPVAAVNNASA